jgi:archaellum biogenesis ATPase FlaH
MINYPYEVQLLFLEMFLNDALSFSRCQNIFDPENFDRKLRPTAQFIQEYTNKYKTVPNINIINSSCQQQFNELTLTPDNYTWLLDEFENFTRHRALERAIVKSADLLEKGDYGPVERLIKDAIQISLSRDMGTDYFKNPRQRLEKLKNNNGQMSTGWPSLDQKLYGGFNRGELNIFAAPSGGGKSLFLANLGINWALMGLNVIYLTFELSEELVSMRMDGMITGITTREIFRNLDDVELKVKMVSKNSGNIQIKYLPSGKNVNDIRAFLKEYQINNGIKPDAILIDYLDLLMPISVKVSPSDLFVKDKYVSEELRNLSMEYNSLTVTASQLNRSAIEEIEFDHSHISGGLSKIQTADNVIGIFSSRSLKDQGKFQIQLMKTRNSNGVGQKLELDYNPDTMRITDNPLNNNQPKPNPLQSLQRTSTVTTQPSPRPSMPNNIRNILANLTKEED